MQEGEEEEEVAVAKAAVVQAPESGVVREAAEVAVGKERGVGMDTARGAEVALEEVAMAAVAVACRPDKHAASSRPRM